MTNLEFYNEFDVLYNNITSNQAPGLDEYEKSVFLTRAQDDIIKSYFSNKTNKTQEGYDGSEIRQADFSKITKTEEFTTFDNALFDNNENSKSVSLKDEVYFIINEYLIVNRKIDNNTVSKRLTVLPINYNKYNTLMSKPFKRPLKTNAWRLMGSNDKGKTVELIVGPNDTIIKYKIRYIIKPTPIILKDLGNLEIDGKSTATECILDPILHRDILQRAVELAKATYIGDLSSQIALGQNSQTNIGYITQNNQQ